MPHERYESAKKWLNDGTLIGQEAYFKEMAVLAKEGYHPAQARLAYAYYYGIGTDIDRGLAFDWAQAAVLNKNRACKYLLGLLYRDHAVELFNDLFSKKQADYISVHWFKKAVERGHSEAKNALAQMKLMGRDFDRADVEGAPPEEEKKHHVITSKPASFFSELRDAVENPKLKPVKSNKVSLTR
jgi:TPR repeat protein